MDTDPVKVMRHYTNKIDGLSKLVSAAWARRTPDIPDFCFLPSTELLDHPAALHHLADIFVIEALIPWRYTQTIYQFNAQLAAALLDSPLDDDTPTSLFHNLPSYSIYIQAPGLTAFGARMHGFWVTPIYSPSVPTDRTVLYILYNTAHTLGEHEGYAVSLDVGKTIHDYTPATVLGLQSPTISLTPKELKRRHDAAKCLQLLMYICSIEPDITPPPPIQIDTQLKIVRPKKRGLRLLPPDQPSIHKVGNHIDLPTAPEPTLATRNHGRGTPKRPHVRRGHWHRYWTGPRDGNQTLRTTWLPPTLINIDRP